MNEAEYLMKNYGDRAASTDNTLRELHNSSYDTKTEFNGCFIIDVKFIFDSARLGLFSYANILQRAAVALLVALLTSSVH